MTKEKDTRVTQSLREAGFVSHLEKTIKSLGITRNALAVESKIRPVTINTLYSAEAKQLSAHTLGEILKALDRIALSKGIEKKHKISDIFEYSDQGS